MFHSSFVAFLWRKVLNLETLHNCHFKKASPVLATSRSISVFYCVYICMMENVCHFRVTLKCVYVCVCVTLMPGSSWNALDHVCVGYLPARNTRWAHLSIMVWLHVVAGFISILECNYYCVELKNNMARFLWKEWLNVLKERWEAVS